MNRDQEILTELREISPLLALEARITPYALPAGYFVHLPELLTEKIQFAEITAGLQDLASYRVPDGYFEGFAASLLDNIAIREEQHLGVSNELDEVAALLNTIDKKPVYHVPATYFESANFVSKAKAPVFTLKLAGRWMQYAAAAVVGGVLVTSAFLFTDNRSNLPLNEIGVHQDMNAAFDKVSEDDLVKFLNNPDHGAVEAATAAPLLMLPGDVHQSIQQLSDEELNQYLTENGETPESLVQEKEK
jgi:hypothetical protein